MRIVNARWLDNSGDFTTGSILIRDGRLKLYPGVPVPPGFGSEIDASRMLVLPGLIDSHTHFRQPGQCYKEGIANGSRCAVAGGVTTVLDMPNNIPPCNSKSRLERKKRLFRDHSIVNWGLHLAWTGERLPVPASEIASLKVFMAQSGLCPGITKPDEIKSCLMQYPKISLHAEDETEFQTRPPDSKGGRFFLRHSDARPRKAIIGALEKIERAIGDVRALAHRNRGLKPGRIILLHVSTAEEIEWIKKMRACGCDIIAETCPHYLFFTQKDQILAGSRLKVNPPLRNAADRQALLKAVQDGTINFVSSDHAPHTPREKADERNAPSGIAGIEWMMPMLLIMVEEKNLNWSTFLDIGVRHVAECYGIHGRDGIKNGNFADLVLIERSEKGEPSSVIYTKAGCNPYSGFSFPWKVSKVFVNGQQVFNNGVFSCDRITRHAAGRDVKRFNNCAKEVYGTEII